MFAKNFISAAPGRSPKSLPLFWWQGWSGGWYVTSIFDLKGFRCHEPGVFIVARRDDTRVTPLLIGCGDDVSDDLYAHYGDALMRAIKAGGKEVHVFLAANVRDEYERVMDDIANGWEITPQRSLASS